MARTNDGRLGVSVNTDTVKVLDEVRAKLLRELGIHASYTQAIQFLSNFYLTHTDKVTE